MNKPLIVGNWKMHGTLESAASLARATVRQVKATVACVVVCPPAVHLCAVAEIVKHSSVQLGAQNCNAEVKGAFTGEISAPMLADAGCAYVIVGHSERRLQCAETGEAVKAKAEAALQAGLTPIICVGETLAERESGKAVEVVLHQLKSSLPSSNRHFVLAYEPVWAIGTGRIPTPDEIGQMHRAIAELVGEGVPVLYGGSVNAANAASILAIPHVGGLLVGGASLDADAFAHIIAAAK